MKELRWQLFVDESGKFLDIEDRSCVFGFLSRVPTQMMEARVRKSLEEAFPEIPWPYHANLLNRTASWLFWAALTLSPLTYRAIAVLSGAPEQAKGLIERIKSAIDAGEEPAYDDLKRIEKLFEYVDGYREFRNAAKERRNAFLSLIRRALEVDAPGSHSAMLTILGTPRGEKIARDSYLSGLTVLLERTAQALALYEGTHVVDLHVATRDVFDPVLERSVKLNRSHLEFASKNAHLPLDKVRFSLNATLPFRHATAGLMIADILCNRAYKTRSQPLDCLHRTLDAFGVNTAHDKFSFFASTGVARDEILRGPHADFDKLEAVKPDWAREQAIAWIQTNNQEGK